MPFVLVFWKCYHLLLYSVLGQCDGSEGQKWLISDIQLLSRDLAYRLDLENTYSLIGKFRLFRLIVEYIECL